MFAVKPFKHHVQDPEVRSLPFRSECLTLSPAQYSQKTWKARGGAAPRHFSLCIRAFRARC